MARDETIKAKSDNFHARALKQNNRLVPAMKQAWSKFRAAKPENAKKMSAIFHSEGYLKNLYPESPALTGDTAGTAASPASETGQPQLGASGAGNSLAARTGEGEEALGGSTLLTGLFSHGLSEEERKKMRFGKGATLLGGLL